MTELLFLLLAAVLGIPGFLAGERNGMGKGRKEKKKKLRPTFHTVLEKNAAAQSKHYTHNWARLEGEKKQGIESGQIVVRRIKTRSAHVFSWGQ